ncbi:MAG: hypothetical protein ACM3N7_06460 [Planctomycetaceae bacterium]
MKKIIFLGLLMAFLPAMVFAQGKIEAPVWNVGDKWVFTDEGTIEVFKVDPNGYVAKFSDHICSFERQDFHTIIFDKSTLQRISALEGAKQIKYKLGLKSIFNFPLSPGKQWEYRYSARAVFPRRVETSRGIPTYDYYEKIKILGWEDIGVRAGKFRTLKIEFIRGNEAQQVGIFPGAANEYKGYYWYAPDVKYLVKCEYDKSWIGQSKEIFNWELTSLQVKK